MSIATRLYLAILALPFVLAALFCATLILWDPLDLRPWSDASPDLDARNYSLLIRPIVAPAQLKSGHEVVLAGTSTTLRVENALLATLGNAGSALNVSQAAQTPADGRVLFLAAAQSPGLQRLVLEVGEIWRRPYLGRSPIGQRTVEALSPAWWQLPEFDQEIIEAIINDARGGTFYHPNWAAEGKQLIPDEDAALTDWQIAGMEQARLAFDPAIVSSGGPDISCDRFGFLLGTLDDVFIITKERDVQVDIIFPVTAYAAYPSLWRIVGDPDGHRELMQMHKCVVNRVAEEAHEPMDNRQMVTVHAIHTDPRIVGDTQGMLDVYHYASPAKMEMIIEDIRDRSRVMTTANFAAHERSLRDGILTAAQKPLAPPL